MLFRSKPFVLYDSAMREIHAVQTDLKGNIYFIAISGGAAGSLPEPKSAGSDISGDGVSVTISLSGTSEKKAAEESPVFKPSSGRSTRRETGNLKSGIYRIAKDSSVELLWSSESETIFGMHVRSDGKVLFSTGNKGRIYLLDKKKYTLLIETTEEQTTKLIPGGGDTFACTSNLAKIYRLNSALNTQGSYESDVKDRKSVV